MKSTTSSMAFSGLLVIFAAAVSGQVVGAPLPQVEPGAAFLLAESGSDRLMEYRVLQELQFKASEDQSERFVELLERKPTAAGPQFELEDAQPSQQPIQQYRSPIQRDRAEYGWH